MTETIATPGGGQLAPTDFIQSVLDRIAYKPGWRFWVATTGSVDGVWNYRQWLWAESPAVDSRDGYERESFTRAVPIDWPNDFEPSEATVVAWVRRSVQQWEVHEMNEFLRLDGEIVHDPHQCPQCVIGGCRA